MNWSMLYAVFAMVGGVFYGEFTKFNEFEKIVRYVSLMSMEDLKQIKEKVLQLA